MIHTSVSLVIELKLNVFESGAM